MRRLILKISSALIVAFALIFFCQASTATSSPSLPSMVKGIYLTQTTVEDTPYLNYLIEHAKIVGISTFVVDLDKPSKRYAQNIELLKKNHIAYVARIVLFPGGGTREQVTNPEIWQRKYRLVQQAVDWGAASVQLDYIRYNSKQPPSEQNALDILKIIQWYKSKVAAYKVPLQVDIFGIASYSPSIHIGQDVRLFSSSVDAICPMLYPSHFEPYREHAVAPYDTIYDALAAMKEQFDDDKVPFKLYPYIELFNYRYPLSHPQRLKYIVAQIHAVEDSGADGWYAWSANNEYDPLFEVLESTKVR